MKKNTGSFESMVPKVRITKELNKYDNIVLFPKKVANAKEALKDPSLRKLMDELKEKETK